MDAGQGKVTSITTTSSPAKPTDAFGFQAKSTTTTYTYFFFEDIDDNWYILRLHNDTKVAAYVKGTDGYESVYVDETSEPSGSQSFSNYGDVF